MTTTPILPTAPVSPKYSTRREDYVDSEGNPVRWGSRYHDPSLDLYYLVLFPGPDKRGWQMLNVSKGTAEFVNPENSRSLVHLTHREYWNGVQAQALALKDL